MASNSVRTRSNCEDDAPVKSYAVFSRSTDVIVQPSACGPRFRHLLLGAIMVLFLHEVGAELLRNMGLFIYSVEHLDKSIGPALGVGKTGELRMMPLH